MLTSFGEKLLDYLLRGSTLTLPSTWYLILDVSLTGDAYTEPTYSSYARAGVPRGTGSWVSAVGAGQSVSSVDVIWPDVDAGYTANEVVRRVFISNQATPSGELLLDVVPLTASVTLVDGGTPTLAGGTLIIDAGE